MNLAGFFFGRNKSVLAPAAKHLRLLLLISVDARNLVNHRISGSIACTASRCVSSICCLGHRNISKNYQPSSHVTTYLASSLLTCLPS